MNSSVKPRNARHYVAGLAASGRHHFTSRDARAALSVSAAAAKLALNRLAKQGVLASPARGFYVIVPPEYHSLGCLPADQFIPALMERLGLPYYVGLLSAAQYHGAAHQRPQAFQVFLAKNRRPIQCGTVRVDFLARARINDGPVTTFNTPRGTDRVSTAEATALHLVGDQRHAGGLSHVGTVLAELADEIDPEKLAAAAVTAPIAWAQRLGYLLEQGGLDDKASGLKTYVHRHARQWAALLPAASRSRARRDDGWKLYVNADVKAEL